jgi:hypothetical protein
VLVLANELDRCFLETPLRPDAVDFRLPQSLGDPCEEALCVPKFSRSSALANSLPSIRLSICRIAPAPFAWRPTDCRLAAEGDRAGAGWPSSRDRGRAGAGR